MNALLCVLMVVSMLTPARLDWFREDWTRFPKHVLGIEQWEGQKSVFRSVQQHPMTVVGSGHKVGKTHLVGSLVATFLCLHHYSRVITTANTFDQVKQNVWGEVRSQVRASRIPLGGTLLTVEWKIAPKWEAVGLSTNSPDSFQGKHAPGGTLIIFDECQDIPLDIWKAAKSMVQDNARWLTIANPTKTSGPHFDACHDPSWNHVVLSCLDHPNIVAGHKVMPGVTQDFIDRYEEGSPEYFARILGVHPEDDDYSLISLRMLRESEDAEPIEEGIHMGVDIARFGGDENVLVVLEDRKVTHEESWRGQDTMQTTGRIIESMKRFDCPDENVHVDVIGVGAGVVDRLHEQGYYVDGVNFAERAQDDWRGVTKPEDKFKNRRAELYWICKELLKDKALIIPPEFRRIRTDLAAPSYSWDSAGRIQIEKKDDIKKRIGRSPDHGDALILALSRSGSRRPTVRYV